MPATLAVAARYLGASASAILPTPGAAPGSRTLAVFAWLFPPKVSGGVYRSLALARYADAGGWRTTVIAGPTPAKPSAAGCYLRQQVPPAVHVHHVKTRASRPLPPWFPSVNGGLANAVRSYFEAAALLDRDPPAVVMASGPPFHSFLAAYWMARRYRARLVLEYRDEWTQCPFEFVPLGTADRRWERKCVRAADLVVFTTESQRRRLMQAVDGADGSTWEVVPNGWEPADGPPVPPRTRRDATGPIILAFVGIMGDHALPGRFLDTLHGAVTMAPDLRQALRIRIVGPVSARAAAQLQGFALREMLDWVDLVPKPEALQAMRDADGLLLFNTPEYERYIPGKMYDYIAAATPVLVYGEGGEIGAAVQQLRAGVIVPLGDAARLRDAVLELRLWDPGAGQAIRETWLARHTREALARRLLTLFDRLIT